MKPKENKEKSLVWTLFKENKENSTAECTLCPAVYQTKGGSTTALNSHLGKKHSAAYDAKKKQREEDEKNKAQRNVSRKTPDVSVLLQQGKTDINPERKKIMIELVCDTVVENNLSFRVPESPSFKALMKFNYPQFVVPSRKYLFGEYLNEQVHLYINTLIERVGKKYVSITVDEWSQIHSNTSLLSIPSSHDLLNRCGKYFSNRLLADSGEEEISQESDEEYSDEG